MRVTVAGGTGDGEQGELRFRSPQLAVGYWEMPDETAQTFRSDGRYRTSDLGRQVDGSAT